MLREMVKEAELSAPRAGGAAILLIEDNPDHRLLECKALETLAGVRVVAVETALEGLARLEHEEFALVIADYRMPGMDGLKLLHILNERRLDVPVVIVTGLGDERVAAKALGEGAYDYIIKEAGYLALLPSVAERAIAAFQTRRQLEEARIRLAESEERYRELVHGIDGIVWEADPETWNFTFVSQRAGAILGYPADLWLSGPGFFVNLVHPDDRDEVLRCCAAATTERRDQVFEFRAVAADGRVVWLRNLVRVIGDGARIARLQGLMVDITERLKMEQELFNAQKLESVGLLAGGIAHDFNNVLTAIHGYSQMVLEQVGEESPCAADLARIMEATERGASLVRQLLAFSRKQVMQPRVLDLNTVVTGMEKMLHRVIGEDIAIVMRLEPELVRVKADPGQIEQVLMNLAVNARDAMPRGGTLTIETATADLDEACAGRYHGLGPGRYARLAVGDTGCGMPPSVQAHIFEPFFTTKEPGKGTGLGLSTVYGIVKQSGGDIRVSSEPGKGSTFEIYLPAVESAAEQEAARRARAEACAGNETILLVEDDDALRELAARILHRAGYTVLCARDAGEAIAIGSGHEGPIHLLLTDVVMPGAGGRELSARLAEMRAELKTLYITGYASGDIDPGGGGDGSIALLQKPFTQEDLTRRVRRVLDSA